MIGDNLPHHIQCADDARAYAAAIAALREAVDAIEGAYKQPLDRLAKMAAEFRQKRDMETAPPQDRIEALRKVLADWLAGDPDGNLKDGNRIVATLSRKAGRAQVDAAALPDAFKTMQPDMSKINAALARGETVPGVVVKVETSLRVL